ncbi:Aste57867_19754 [Aphanomyces stellatus]|uniref:Aste57867_19754 protein n=1 Tax=Aphanomyces stellatus TaxID=120398 RepID=A0A485LEU0_9STRA|nr:hypothetical protein As57867_019689 [Aphanomyces stellatus]VFT96452.1 Aste57867_19754 [Aphanomyces stellatus]
MQEQSVVLSSMVKVHTAQGTTATKNNVVKLNKFSLVYSCVFVANLVTEPLKAYVSEPLPWSLNATLLDNANSSFNDFVNSTYNLFASKYNNRTLSPNTMVSHDKDANTVLLRYIVALPSNEVDGCNSYLINFPGSMLYGKGLVEFVCNFLAQSPSAQQLAMPRYMCQHFLFARYFVIGEHCVWIEPLPKPGIFSVYHALQVTEKSPWSWIKFSFRLCVSGCIFFEIWRLYYRHYGPLLSNLKALGIQQVGKSSSMYIVYVGDPTWIILSHPYISLTMIVDILYSTSYSVVSLFRVNQLQDFWQFVIGSFCGSNFVWASYAAMRYSTSLIKYFRWEKYFEPLDPSTMALTASFYAGPLLYLICHSPLILMFQFLIQVFPVMKMENMEVSVGMCVFLIIFASVPLLNSAISRCFHKRKRRISNTKKRV